MTVEFDTFLVALYTVVDDLYRAHLAPHKPRRPGRQPDVADSEVLTLALLGHWLGRSERGLGRYAARHWQTYFPRLLDHSAFNRRVRDLAGVLVALGPLVARELGAALTAYQALDGMPVPLARRCRGTRHRLFGVEAAIGRGGSDRDWYFGCHLLVAVTAEGAITGFVLGPADTDGRWLADALLCWRCDPTAVPVQPDALPPSHHQGGGRRGPTGPIWPASGAGAWSAGPYLGDRGFRGEAWAAHWDADYGADVRTHATYQPEDVADGARRLHAAERQVVETVNGQLADTFHLQYPGAKTRWGLLARIAAKLAALNVGLWLNRYFGRRPFALATLFS